MPQKMPVARKATYPNAQKSVTRPPKRGQTKQQAVHGKEFQPSKGVKAVGSKVGLGAQTAAHTKTPGILKAFQFAKSSDGKALAALHMKGKAGKTAQNQGYRK
jgi:hypothetical protein